MRIALKCQVPRSCTDCNLNQSLTRTSRWMKKQISHCDSAVLSIACFMITIVVIIILIVWLNVRDPCESYKVKQKVCEDYMNGLAAGFWCFELCVENSISLSSCLSQDQYSSAFFWQDRIVKIHHSTNPTSSLTNKKLPRHLTDINKSLSTEIFNELLTKFIYSKLGPDTDQTLLINKILKFADFNEDHEITFGEANSIWELLQVHEFFILLLFQEDSFFPSINGTCGNLYFYDNTGEIQLFNKHDKGIFDNFFSNTYRWKFPEWQKRANIVMGLLEFAAALYEKSNANFYMCDISATKFGFEKYEAKVISVEKIISQKMLEDIMIGRYCYIDQDCMYGNACMTSCDNRSGNCDNIVIKPNIVSVCEIIQDFLLFDTPSDIKPELVHLLSQCVNLSHNISTSSDRHIQQGFLSHNIILSQLKTLIWDQIKEQPSNWLMPKIPKVL